MGFVYLHIGWFGAWLLGNTGRVGLPPFDPFPYGLLTMIVSLEAIFLSTFVLIGQNRFGDAADRRAELDVRIGLLVEPERTRVLQMLDAIQENLALRTTRTASWPTWRWRPDPKTCSLRLTVCTARSKADARQPRHAQGRERRQQRTASVPLCQRLGDGAV